MSKDIETIEEVLKQFAPDHWAILDLGQALQQIEKIIKERVINTGFVYDPYPSEYDFVQNELREKQYQALTNALYGKGEDNE